MKKNRVGKKCITSGSWATMGFGLLALAALCTCALAQENSAESWYMKGQELEKMGSWQAAVDTYNQAIRLNPEYEAAWRAKCKALSNANLELSGEEQNTTFVEAIQACDKAIDIDPRSARSWSGKGFVFYQEFIVTADPGKLNESLLAYEKAIEVAGSDTSALTEAWRGKGTSSIPDGAKWRSASRPGESHRAERVRRRGLDGARPWLSPNWGEMKRQSKHMTGSSSSTQVKGREYSTILTSGTPKVVPWKSWDARRKRLMPTTSPSRTWTPS